MDTTDDREDDALPAKTPPTPEEIAEFEKQVRQLIRFKAAFNDEFRFLDDRLREKERAKKPGD